jgi:hypothetical protein
MSDRIFQAALWALALAFTVVFVSVVGPQLAIDNWDVSYALGQGFVNPYSSGYAWDIVFSYAVLVVWVLYEALARGVKHGWVVVILGFVPGVAVALAAYLLIRHRQVQTAT